MLALPTTVKQNSRSVEFFAHLTRFSIIVRQISFTLQTTVIAVGKLLSMKGTASSHVWHTVAAQGPWGARLPPVEKRLNTCNADSRMVKTMSHGSCNNREALNKGGQREFLVTPSRCDVHTFAWVISVTSFLRSDHLTMIEKYWTSKSHATQ